MATEVIILNQRPSKLKMIKEVYKVGGLWHVLREGTLATLSDIAIMILPHLPAWDRRVDDQTK